MQLAIDETRRRREVQEAYNTEHGITPTTIVALHREPARRSWSPGDFVESRLERAPGKSDGRASDPIPTTPAQIPTCC
jgi:excinuclease UvrABC helicase subunit UvrB